MLEMGDSEEDLLWSLGGLDSGRCDGGDCIFLVDLELPSVKLIQLAIPTVDFGWGDGDEPRGKYS